MPLKPDSLWDFTLLFETTWLCQDLPLPICRFVTWHPWLSGQDGSSELHCGVVQNPFILFKSEFLVSLRDEVASPSNNLKHFPPPQRCPLTTYSEDQYSATEAATVQVRSIPLSWFLTAQTWPRWSSALPLQSHPTVLFSSQPSCPV